MKQILLLYIVVFISCSIKVNAEITAEVGSEDFLSGVDEHIEPDVNRGDSLSETDYSDIEVTDGRLEQDVSLMNSMEDTSSAPSDNPSETTPDRSLYRTAEFPDKLLRMQPQPVEHQIIAAQTHVIYPTSPTDEFPTDEFEPEKTDAALKMDAGHSLNVSQGKILKPEILRGSTVMLEPTSVMLFMLGLLGLGLIRRRKNNS